MRPVRTLIAVFILAAMAGPAAARDDRPNIVFIFSDDHGAQAISTYGSKLVQTPAIDRLAAEGMRFDDCFCGNSICAPSRATILTGLHSHRSGHTSNDRIFDNRAATFPELLHDAGYQTALIGKWHLEAEPEGFDFWDVLIKQGVYYNPDMIRNGQFHRTHGYATDLITDESIEWLEHRDPDRPFLLLSQHKAPHRSWEPPLRNLDLFADSTIPEPPTLFDDWSHRSSAHTYAHMSIARDLWPGDLHLEEIPDMFTPGQRAAWDSAYTPRNRAFRAAHLEGDALTRWKYQRYAKDYLRCVAALDEDIGRLLAYLDATGLARNTIVIYSSDQGWFLGEHGMFDKRWMYEESFRMPLIVRWPGVVRPGAVNTDLVQNIDFAPTLLEAAGVPVPPAMQGVSLVPLLEGRHPAEWRTSLYYQFYEDGGAHRVPRHCGVRTPRWSYLDFYRIHETELFDVDADPHELVSLANDPAHAALRDSLAGVMRRLQLIYGVTTAADTEYDDFDRYQHRRWALIDSIGRMPPFGEFTAETLATRTHADHDELSLRYRIGGQTVPAVLFVPKGGAGLTPGVVLIHSGRAAGPFRQGLERVAGGARAAALALCRRGFAVIAPDRFGYGGRRFASDAEAARGFAAAERTYRAEGSSLLAHELAELWFAQAYLARLSGVEFLRVGAIGFGEGGDLALLLAALDPEVAAAASVGGADSFAAAAFRPASALARLDEPPVRAWGAMAGVIPLVQPRPLLCVGEGPRRPAMFEEGEGWYRLHDMSARLAYERAGGPGAPEASAGAARAAAWLDRWLIGP